MKKQKDYTLPALTTAFVLVFCSVCMLFVMGCHDTQSQAHDQSLNEDTVVYVEYFKQGEELLPDNICSDTLIVMDAVGLNKAMGLVEQNKSRDMSRTQFDSLFHLYCRIK